MTLDQARKTIDSARDGEPIATSLIRQALRVTGDLTTRRQQVREPDWIEAAARANIWPRKANQ